MRKKGTALNFIMSAATDVGIEKETNQDSFGAKLVQTACGNIAVCIMCDGMGGYAKGEVASATVVNIFNKWILERLPVLCADSIRGDIIRQEWEKLVQIASRKISDYGVKKNITLGTTLTVIMLTETEYYILNVGDSRAYEIADAVTVLTKDQTVVAREVELGVLTEEEAKTDPRRSVLLQCIGASDYIEPDFFTGKVKKDSVYMLCSDGFRHEVSNAEIFQYMQPAVMVDPEQMRQNMEALIELNKQRYETDNISVLSVRTF
ncbi:MAG TPA: serine/threonine-protein phosphatase [Ruminococcus sp.]|nr:serine/threonine-protein phosphatase [Ruminococcus sp.]